MLYTKSKKLFALAVLFFVSVLLTSCGIWTNFTTYFNTYYNAKTLFENCEDELKKQNRDPFIFREEDQLVNQKNVPGQNRQINQPQQNFGNRNSGQQTTAPVSNQQIMQDLTKVIEKCSKILQYDRESSYFDDALFITGKAFYYQAEYARAQRKFLELATVPETDYALENKLWLAKTYLQLRSFDEGLKLLEDVKNTSFQNEDYEMFDNASITKISFLIYREEYQAAINECQSFLKNIDDDEMTALIWFQMGKIYMKQNDEENALNAFASVLNYSPTYEIEFESRLEHALLLKELNKLDESENELNDLSNEGKFKNQLDRILVELGKIYYDNNNNESALGVFMEVDSTYRLTQSAGEAEYMIGQLYENKFGDYDSAYKYYVKTVSSQALYDTKIESGNKMRNMDKYFALRSTIREREKSLIYLTEPTRFMQDSIDYNLAYEEFMADVKYKTDSLETVQAEQQTNTNTTVNAETARRMLEQRVQNDIQQNIVNKYRNARINLTPTYKDLVIQGKIKKPEMPKMKPDSAKGLLAKDYYDLGNMFFSELEVPDSAYYYYNLVLKDYSKSPSEVPTLFAMGTYFETENQKEKADSLYQIIYDNYPKDALYTQAAIKLGKIKPDEKKKVTVTDDPAEPDYIAAEELYYEKNYPSALNALRNLYLKYPKSSFVPKSFYFIGLIYEEKLKMYDSAAVFYGILSSKEYSNTPYYNAVSGKYFAYKGEMDKIEQEKQAKIAEEERRKQAEKTNAAVDSSTVNKNNSDKTPVSKAVIRDEVKESKVVRDTTAAPAENLKQNELEKLNNGHPDSIKLNSDTVKKDSLLSKEILQKQKIPNQQKPDTSKNKPKIVD